MTDTLRTPETFPEGNSNIILRGPAGDLEAVTHTAEQESTHPAIGKATAIICHGVIQNAAHMHNKVVMMMDRSMRELGINTIKFDFRGVGASEGEYDAGHGESQDLLAVAAWVKTVQPDHDLWLGGYGFGCYVTIRACQKLDIKHLISISPPVERYDFESLPEPQCPWLVIQGMDDDKVNPEAVYKWVDSNQTPPQLIRIPDANNDYHRHLMDLRGVIKNGVRRQLPAGTP